MLVAAVAAHFTDVGRTTFNTPKVSYRVCEQFGRAHVACVVPCQWLFCPVRRIIEMRKHGNLLFRYSLAFKLEELF